LKGKKGMIEDVAKQITLVSAKLANLAETPGMASSVTKLQAEVSKIAAEMGALLDKKNKEINKDDIKKAAARLAEIPTEADKMAEKMLKQDATNREASSILVQAFGLVQTAKNLEKAYLAKKEEAKQKETDAKIKVTLVVPTIDYTPEETKNVNPEVKKFQELVVDKFGKIKAITSLPQYTKMGTDGKFGPNTRDIVKVLKRGFGLTDTSGDITKELVDEIQIQADTIKESVNTRIFKFSDFINLSEAAFDSSVAIEYAKSLPTYKPVSASSRTARLAATSSSGSSILFKEGSKGPEVTAIQNAVGAKNLGTEEYKNQTFGPKTKEAVIAWQKANGLKDDGIVGIGTIKKMAEIKNLGKWTASVISKLAGSEVKAAEVKPEVSKIDQMGVNEIAKDIKDSLSGNGTDEDKLKNSILKIKNIEEFKAVEEELRNLFEEDGEPRADKPIQVLVNNELGNSDFEVVKSIVNHLKKVIKLNAEYKSKEGLTGGKEFVEDSFKYNY
jgi:peptidoglycan hydrolase-like protein with peptidoglycan-binding domain